MLQVAHAGESSTSPLAVDEGAQAPARWNALREQALQLPEPRRIGHVNSAVNAFVYRSDREMHGVDDYWDAPFELMQRGAGDCEDFAIAKYMLLLQAGIPRERLKMAFAFHDASGSGEALRAPAGPQRTHVVVLYEPEIGSEPLVLDMISQIAPLAARPDLRLVFDFDDLATYAIHAPEVSTTAVQRMMNRWIAALQRAGAVGDEGLRATARRPGGPGGLASVAGVRR
jgi:Bacterial transglutaminase-like cysteine proteinase BTLCP